MSQTHLILSKQTTAQWLDFLTEVQTMANFEAQETKIAAESKSAPSNLFNDAYNYVSENPAKSAAVVATGVMAIGALVATRGRSALRESLATVEHTALPAAAERLALAAPAPKLALAAPVREAALELPLQHMPAGILRDRLTLGAAISGKPQYLTQIEMGLPRNMDALTARKLETAIVSRDTVGVANTMDEIFGAPSTYAQMRRTFGG